MQNDWNNQQGYGHEDDDDFDGEEIDYPDDGDDSDDEQDLEYELEQEFDEDEYFSDEEDDVDSWS
jgi:hypothetical protein